MTEYRRLVVRNISLRYNSLYYRYYHDEILGKADLRSLYCIFHNGRALPKNILYFWTAVYSTVIATRMVGNVFGLTFKGIGALVCLYTSSKVVIMSSVTHVKDK